MAEWSSSTITCVEEGEQRVALASQVSNEQCEHVKPLPLLRLGQLPSAPSPRTLMNFSSDGFPRKVRVHVELPPYLGKKATWRRRRQQFPRRSALLKCGYISRRRVKTSNSRRRGQYWFRLVSLESMCVAHIFLQRLEWTKLFSIILQASSSILCSMHGGTLRPEC